IQGQHAIGERERSRWRTIQQHRGDIQVTGSRSDHPHVLRIDGDLAGLDLRTVIRLTAAQVLTYLLGDRHSTMIQSLASRSVCEASHGTSFPPTVLRYR